MRRFWLLLVVLGASVCAPASERLCLVRPAEYFGMCDASAAVPVSSNLFIAASDEDSRLRLYRGDQPGLPVKEFDFTAFLEVTGRFVETDLEAAARIGDRAYWIGSHGRNREAKERLNRCRFFATDIKLSAGGVDLLPVGRPYKSLLDDFIRDTRLQRFDLDRAADRAPKDANGLNIEGLAATPEGHLLLGFRNPNPEGKALIIPLLNPDEVVEGQRAKLDVPLLLDLDGLGVRDMALYQGSYVIIAGSYHGGGRFRLFRWAGGDAAPQHVKVDHLNRYNPEAIIIYPDKGLREFQILSDDGERLIDGIPGKQVKDPARQKFRSFWLSERE